nr:hypothetical protein [Tanacetum cinerariifolium]
MVLYVGNKMHKAFPLSVKSSHCQKKFPLLVRKVPPTEDKRCHCQEDRTAIKDKDFRKDSYYRIMYRTPCPIKGVLRLLSATITLSNKAKDPILGNIKWYQSLVRSFDLQKNNIQSTSYLPKQKFTTEMEHSNITPAKILILDTRKFEQWQFRIQQYLQHEHYALWDVIEFGDSYEAPNDVVATDSKTKGTGKKKGRTVALTTKDMQKRKNDVKAITTLLLALPNEHQLRFSKYKTAQELWAAILKTFGGNEATKKIEEEFVKTAVRKLQSRRLENFRADF